MEDENRRPWLALAVICAGELMIVLDATIVTIALPQIQDGLGFTDTGLAWAVNAYLLTFGGLLLLAGRAADIFGPRRLFVAGLGVFTVASLLCGIATEAWMLVAARALQGVGGAIVTAVALALLVINFPEPRERAKAMGIWTFVAAGGGSVGVTLGGVLTQAFDWRWIFLVNLPVGVGAVALTLVALAPDPAAGGRRRLDVAGAVLATGASTAAVAAFVGAETAGWGSGRTVGLLAAAAAMAAGFVLVERRVAEPLVPAHLFRSRNLTAGCGVSILTIIGLFGWFFIGTLYLQNVLGYDPLETGLAFLPATLLLGAMSVGPSAALVRRFGPKPPLATGLGLMVVGLALLARAPVDGSLAVDVVPAMLLIGIGIGMSFMPLFLLSMSDVPESEAGISSGLITTSQEIGGAIGVAILVAVAAARTGSVAGDPTAALNAGYQAAFWCGAALSAIAIPVSLWAFTGGRDVAGGMETGGAGH